MEMQLSKILCLLLSITLSCNGGAQDKVKDKNQSQKSSTDILNINFLDKKYKQDYSIIIDESNLSDHPIYSFLNCKKEGYFTVHAIPIEDNVKYFWEESYPKKSKEYEEEKLFVKNKMSEDPHGYTFFVYWIPSKYINRKDNCTEESIVIDTNAVAKIYNYNTESKKWIFLKEFKSNTLPQYRDNKFFESEFPSFFSLNNVTNPYSNYLSILLYSYKKDGITSKTILSEKSKAIVESTISKYTLQEDFYKDSFFKRESKIIDNSISQENIKVWNLCNEKLDFSKVVPEESLESDWRFPYKSIKSLNKIYALYKDENYGDSFEGQTLPQQMALYMYFLPWKEREKIFEDIDKIKLKIQTEQN